MYRFLKMGTVYVFQWCFIVFSVILLRYYASRYMRGAGDVASAIVLFVGFLLCSGWDRALMLLIISLFLLWVKSSTFRYFVRLWGFYTFVMSCALFYIPFTLFKPCHHSNLRGMQLFWQKVLHMFSITTEIRQKENLLYDKPCVIVCNHQSALDLIAMMDSMPVNSTVLAKKELIYAGPFGLCAWLSGLVFVNRSNRSSAVETMKRVAKIMHERQANNSYIDQDRECYRILMDEMQGIVTALSQIKIWIFPEGTRNLNGNLLPFKKGAFHLAVEAQVPIMPIVNSSYRDFLCTKRRIFNPGEVIITCLPLISTEGITPDQTNDLVARVQDEMEKVYRETSKEIHERFVKTGRSILNDCSKSSS